tara:strand:- start:865 stop:1020 length:156 start_codon:yes stop_codon:yes gene_type:complete
MNLSQKGMLLVGKVTNAELGMLMVNRKEVPEIGLVMPLLVLEMRLTEPAIK